MFNSVDKSFLFAFNFNNQTANVKCAFRLTCSKLLNGLRLLGLLGHVDTNPFSFENATFFYLFSKSFPSILKRFRIIFIVHTEMGNDVIPLNCWNEGHMLIVKSTFSKSSFFAIYMYTTTGKRVFINFYSGERFRKVGFSMTKTTA